MKLSIIVPVYNLEKFISATLESLLSIDFPYDYEIILIDDGSSDNSRAVIEEYCKKTDKICLISIDNAGVSNARNVGLRRVTGEYVSFVDGDDTVEQDFFKTAIQELDAGGFDFVQANIRIVMGDKNKYIQFNPEDEVIRDRNTMLERFFGPGKKLNNSACAKVFRTDLLRDKAFDCSIRIAEDQKFVFDVIQSAKAIKLLKIVGYNYLQRTDSAMHELDRNRAEDILKVLDYCRDGIDSDRVRKLIDADRLDILFFIYHDRLINSEDCEQVYSEIIALDRKKLKKTMSHKAQVKAVLLRNARGVYDRFVIARHNKSRR